MSMHRFGLALSVAGLAVTGAAQNTTYAPGVTFQNFNPNYPKPNPFFFEGKIDWDKLGVTQPANAWEYAQRAIHKQDDLGDIAGAITDYQTALDLNSLPKGTCQLVTSATLVNGVLPSTLNPAPCMFTLRLRLAYLVRKDAPETSIALYKEVQQIDPLRLDVSALLAEVYVIEAENAATPAAKQAAYTNAIAAYNAELQLSPVTPDYTALTGDEANNAHVHWGLAEVYEKLNRPADALRELDLYLKATKWHSDTYPWRIPLAQKKIVTLGKELAQPATIHSVHGEKLCNDAAGCGQRDGR
jgi:tetratricopeptide (TPR) repeat protein